MFLQCNERAEFSIAHIFDCKNFGLITTWNNKLYDRVANLAIKDFTPLNVLHDSLIQNGHSMHGKKALMAGNQGGDITKMTMLEREESPSLSHAVNILEKNKNNFN